MTNPHLEPVAKGCEHIRYPGMDVLLLGKPSKLFYITGDSRWCVYTRIGH